MKLKERLTEWWPVICMLSLYTSNFHILISMSNDLVSWKKSPQTSNEMRYGNWLVSSEPCTTNTMNNICFYPPDTEWLMEGEKENCLGPPISIPDNGDSSEGCCWCTSAATTSSVPVSFVFSSSVPLSFVLSTRNIL